MYDTIIIGSGPSGVSAAVYLKRSGFDVLVLSTNDSALKKAKIIENYYGFPEITGKELYDLGIKWRDRLDPCGKWKLKKILYHKCFLYNLLFLLIFFLRRLFLQLVFLLWITYLENIFFPQFSLLVVNYMVGQEKLYRIFRFSNFLML